MNWTLAIISFLGGIVLSAIHYRGLRENTRLWLDDKRRGWAVVLHLVRFVITGGGFYLFSRQGPVSIVAALIGFVITKPFIMRWQKGDP